MLDRSDVHVSSRSWLLFDHRKRGEGSGSDPRPCLGEGEAVTKTSSALRMFFSDPRFSMGLAFGASYMAYICCPMHP